MKCRHLKAYLLETDKPAFSYIKKSEFREHIKNCPHCRHYCDQLMQLRGHLKDIETVKPSHNVLEKTLQACRTQLQQTAQASLAQRESFQIPKLVWVALAGLLMLTLMFLSPALLNSILEEPIPYPISVVVIIALQNVLMLFFSPILLKIKQGGEGHLYFR